VDGRGDNPDDVTLHSMRSNPERLMTIPVSDPDFSYKAAPLGYMFYNNMAFYVMRFPTRQNKAGLPQDCLATEPQLESYLYYSSHAFEKCILGKHDTLATALKKLIPFEKVQSVPIHRHVALGWNHSRIVLYYRTRPVGYYDQEFNRFNLNDGPDLSFIQRIMANLEIGVQ
jgi:hypothetical protein